MVYYSSDRLQHTKRKLRAFWNGEIETVYSAYPSEHHYRQLEDHDKMVREAVLNIKAGEGLPGYNIPRFAVDFGTISTASYWGGKEYRPGGGNPWIDPVIMSPSDVPGMKAMDAEGGHALMGLEIYRRFCERLGSSDVPCTTYDIQGPLNTLSLMWEQQDFMMSMYDEPDTVHSALRKVTLQLIECIRGQLRMNPAIEAPLWPYIWLPRDIGIGVTEDYMPLVSPGLYREFGLPYVERLSDEFGGLFIHCCGMFTHQIDNLLESRANFIGFEFAYPHVDVERLFHGFGSSAVFVPNIMDKCLSEFGGLAGYFKEIEKLRKEGTRIWYLLRPDLEDFEEQVELMKRITGEV